MKRFGLVGYPLGHSFSRNFFQEKFMQLKLKDHQYDLYEIEFLNEFPALWMRYKDLIGLNVTVPHKETVLKYLNRMDTSCIKVGAANVILKKKGELIGYNTDYMAFKETLTDWISVDFKGEAMILGSGGASKAVQAALIELEIPFNLVSRTLNNGDYTYDQIMSTPEICERFKLVINTTPLGMYPNVDEAPLLPYHLIGKDCYFYDLIYNPSETAFLAKAKKQGAKTKNGLKMLELQAEMSWNIWNS